jgi:capsule polysaccharide export protein KpsE/RkpR
MTYTIKGYLADESVLSKILNSLNIKDIYLARGKG